MTTVERLSLPGKMVHKINEKHDEPIFQNQMEELDYLRTKVQEKEKELQDLEETFNDFQQSSKELESEMERELTTNEKKLKDMSSLYHRLKSEHDEMIEKSRRIAEDSGKMIHNLQDETESLKKATKDLRREKQRLEQENDQLERRVREAEASLHDLTEKMNKTLEENSFLQTELEDSKNRSQESIQRMKDEMKDIRLELELMNQVNAKQDGSEPPILKGSAISSNHTSTPKIVRNGSSLVRSRSKEGSIDLVDDILALVKDMEWKLLSQKDSSSISDNEEY